MDVDLLTLPKNCHASYFNTCFSSFTSGLLEWRRLLIQLRELYKYDILGCAGAKRRLLVVVVYYYMTGVVEWLSLNK